MMIICDAAEFDRIGTISIATGFGIELQGYGDPVYEGNHIQPPHWDQALLSSIRLKALHAPFPDLCPGSVDPLLRQVARHRFEAACDAAFAAGAEHVVFHHGYVPRTSRPPGWIDRSALFWRELLNAYPGLRPAS